jgi:hypothetical protein
MRAVKEDSVMALHQAVWGRNWDAFLSRLSTEKGKAEGREWDNGEGHIVHSVFSNRAPDNVIHAVLEAYPEGLMCPSPSDGTTYPIFVALGSADPDPETIRVMLRVQPNQAKLERVAVAKGYLPLHYIYDSETSQHITETKREAIARLLLDAYPEAVTAQEKQEDIEYLLILAMRNSGVGYGSMKVLVNATNNQFIQYDGILHDICSHHHMCNGIDQKIRLILDMWPEAAGIKERNDWQLPIHVLVQGTPFERHGQHLPELESALEHAFILLATSCPEGLMIPDMHGVLPFTRLTTNCCPSRFVWNMMFQLCPKALYKMPMSAVTVVSPLRNVMSGIRLCMTHTRSDPVDTSLTTPEVTAAPEDYLHMRHVESYALQTTFRALLMSGRRAGVSIPKYTGSESALQQLCYLAYFVERARFQDLLYGHLFSERPSSSASSNNNNNSIVIPYDLQSILAIRDENQNSPLHFLSAATQLTSPARPALFRHANTLQECRDCEDPSFLSPMGIFIFLILNGNRHAAVRTSDGDSIGTNDQFSLPLANAQTITVGATNILKEMAMDTNSRGELPLHVWLKTKSYAQDLGVVEGSGHFLTIMERCAIATLVVSLDIQSSAILDPVEGLYPFMYAACGGDGGGAEIASAAGLNLNTGPRSRSIINKPCLSLTYTLLRMFVAVGDVASMY